LASKDRINFFRAILEKKSKFALEPQRA